MSRPCTQCKNEVLDADLFCKYCLATKCLRCSEHGSILRFSHEQLNNHHLEHSSIVAKGSLSSDELFWIQCPAELCDGCDTINAASQRDCSQCHKKLWIESHDITPARRYYLGQIIYFLRRDTGFPVRGFIVGEGSLNDHAIVRYYERCYRLPRYDESCAMTEIFTSLDEANKHVKSNRRGSASTVVRPQVIDSRPTKPSKLREARTISTDRIKSSPPQKVSKNMANSSPRQPRSPSLSPVTSIQSSSLKIKSSSKSDISLDVVETFTDHSTSSVHASSLKPSSWLDASMAKYDIDTIQSSIEIPAYPTNAITMKCMHHIDEYILRGLLYAINNWLRPASRTIHSSSLLSSIFTIRMLEDVLRHCPSSEIELSALESCQSLLSTTNAAGETILDVIRYYLKSRSCLDTTVNSQGWRSRSRAAIDQLKALRLELPVRYPTFLSIIDLAYESLGGRQQLENSRGVKGLVKIQGDHQVAMYGGKIRPCYIDLI